MSINNKVGYEIDVSSVDQATAKIKQFSDTMNQTGTAGQAALAKVETSTSTATSAMTNLSKSADTVKGSFSSAAVAITGLSANMASLYFSFDQLDKVSVRLERSQLAVARAEYIVNDLHAKGKDGTQQYALAVQSLQVAQDRYNAQSNDLIQTQVMIGLQFTTMATTTIPSAIKAVQALQVTQEGFAVVLEATMPWLLAITAALLAWEYVIAPLIKQHTNLDLGIQSNIQKLVQQHNAIQDNSGAMNDLTSTYTTADGTISQTAGAFDTLGTSISGATQQLTEMEQAFKDLQSGNLGSSTLAGGESLLSKNDPFSQIKQRIDQVKSYESDIQTFMDDGIDKQKAMGLVMDHYLLQLQEEKSSLNESNDQYQKKVDLLTQAVAKAGQLVDLSKQQLEQDKKKQQLINDLSTTTGIPAGVIALSFTQLGGAGNAFNPGLQELYNQSVRNFGSQFVGSALGQQLGMFGARPFYEGVGYGGISNAGGGQMSMSGLQNDDIHNMLVSLVADTHMFGENYGRDKDLLRQAVDNGEAQQQAIFEQNSAEWQKFYALRNAGLFTGDPNLSLEENLANAEKAYDQIFSGLRPDVAAALRAANEQTAHYQLYADARSPGIAVTRYHFEIPSKDELKKAIADSLFSGEVQFQEGMQELEKTFTLTASQVIDALQTPDGQRDFQNMLAFQNMDKLKGLAT